MPYKFFFTAKTLKLFQENYHHFLNNQSLELNSLSEIDNIIKEKEEILKENPTEGLPEVSKLIDSAICKRQGDRRKHSFLERKKNTA